MSLSRCCSASSSVELRAARGCSRRMRRTVLREMCSSRLISCSEWPWARKARTLSHIWMGVIGEPPQFAHELAQPLARALQQRLQLAKFGHRLALGAALQARGRAVLFALAHAVKEQPRVI